MFKILLLLCISISCINALKISELARKTLSPHLHQVWAEWKEKYYPGEGDNTECDDEKHIKQFEKNNDKIKKFEDAKKTNGDTFDEGCTKYCCFSSDEMTSHEGANVPKDVHLLGEMFKIEKLGYLLEHLKDVPIKIMPKAKSKAVNWVTQKHDPPIKNQKSCGSCWAFAVVGTVEAAFSIAGGDMLDLSEQQLVDCDKGNNGCNGGWMTDAYKHLKKAGTILESDYPYQARRQSCQESSKNKVDYTVDGWNQISWNSQDSLASAVEKGTVSVAVDAGNWHQYDSGIINDRSWCNGQVNHAVVVVGYGTDSATGLDYWLVRNSWGTSWGEDGYIRIQKTSGSGDAGMCNIAYAGYWPNVTASGSSPQPSPSPSPSPQPTPSDPCAVCGAEWWTSVTCIHCYFDNLKQKHKWFKSDLSNLTDQQETILAREIVRMKETFENSLEEGEIEI